MYDRKKLAHKKYLQTKTIDSVIEHKRSRAIVKTEIRKRRRKSCEKFVSRSMCHIQVKPNTLKLLEHVNKDVTESANY
jgi:hypothetical protein